MRTNCPPLLRFYLENVEASLGTPTLSMYTFYLVWFSFSPSCFVKTKQINCPHPFFVLLFNRVSFQCRYNGVGVEAVIFQSLELPSPQPFGALGPLRAELRLGNGQCTSKGCVEG